MSDVLAHINRQKIRSHMWRWVALWLASDEDVGRMALFFYSHGDDWVPGMPTGKRVKVTFELEDDPNADLLQEATHADN